MKILSPNDISRLKKHISHPRDIAIISLILETGCYVDDLLTVTLNDINHTTKEIQFQHKKTCLVRLSADTYTTLTQWILQRPTTVNPHIFITYTTPFRPLTARGIDAMLRKWGDITTIPFLNMQVLRRTAKHHVSTQISPTSVSSPTQKQTHSLVLALYAAAFLYRCITLIKRN